MRDEPRVGAEAMHVLALYRASRTSDALDAYPRHARTLDDELGLQPGAELRDLLPAVLLQARELAAWRCHPERTGAVEVVTTVHVPGCPPTEMSVEMADAILATCG